MRSFEKQLQYTISIALVLLLLMPAVSGAYQHDHASDFSAGSTHTDDRPHQHHDHHIRIPAKGESVEWLPADISLLPATQISPDLNDPVFSIDRPPKTTALIS